DLVPLRITEEMIEEARKSLQELPTDKHKRFMEEYGLSDYDAGVLTAEKNVAGYFETVTRSTGFSPKEMGKEVSNWVTVELLGLLHKGRPRADGSVEPLTIGQSPVLPQALADLLVMKRKGDVSGPIAKSVLEEMFNTGQSAAEIVKAKGLTQVSDEGALEKIIDDVMAKNPQQLAQYRSGKEAVFGFFVGQVMKSSGGKANPAKVNELLKRKLAQ
ncbi:MAG: Asp-tRNA(Asn)/Glu-tRNA(Gln) amidotransferase GatCAB subunit B, partial [Nitrospirota bacterium]